MRGLVSEILIIVVVIASTAIVISSVTPILEEGKKSQSVNEAKQILNTIDTVVNQLAFEAPSAKRSINIDLRDGRFVFSGKDDRIKIRIDDTGLLKPGVRVEEGNILFQGGDVLDVYETDIFDDGQMDFVMENSAVIFAIKKMGNETNPVSINTSSIITLIRNKVSNVNITPRSGVFINDIVKSSYGIGYTDLTLPINQQTASIIIHMNSQANISYDAIFTLSASMDFVELEVKNIKKNT